MTPDEYIDEGVDWLAEQAGDRAEHESGKPTPDDDGGFQGPIPDDLEGELF